MERREVERREVERREAERREAERREVDCLCHLQNRAKVTSLEVCPANYTDNEVVSM